MKAKPEAVIFDIGNVLIEWLPENFYDATIGEERRKALFAEIDLHGMNERVDLGEGFQSVIYETADAHPKWRDEVRMWHDNWLDLATPAIDGSVSVLAELKARKVPVYALTNFGIESFDLACRHYGFLNSFDKAYVSGHMKVTKPSARIYEMVEEDCGLDPSSLIFTDDRPENVDAAKARGWQTHLFSGPEGWREALVTAGML